MEEWWKEQRMGANNFQTFAAQRAYIIALSELKYVYIVTRHTGSLTPCYFGGGISKLYVDCNTVCHVNYTSPELIHVK